MISLSSTPLIHIRRQKIYPSTSQDYGQPFRDVSIPSQGLMDKDPSVNLSIQHRFKPPRPTWSVIIAELSPSLPYCRLLITNQIILLVAPIVVMTTSKLSGYYDAPEGVDVRGRYDEEFAKILTREALEFVAGLQRQFRRQIRHAMESRREAQRRYDAGGLPGFDPATRFIRESDWVCAPVPPPIANRMVEITGPVERKMVINALNSGAKVFMADFEDALSPNWENLMKGQVNLRDAVNGTISFEDRERKRVYKLNETTAKLFVRPRGWHLKEGHILIDGEPAVGCLVDFGLFFSHNYAAYRATQGQGFGPFFYLPKMEHSREARIWNSVFNRAEESASIPAGSIRATVLIETLPAAFQMNEILYELRSHSAGLNCGRWDYIFSYVKTLRAHPDRLLPDRVSVGMWQSMMRSYSHLLIFTCHRRGVHALGGMAAQIPIRGDPAAHAKAIEAVRSDKLREVQAGHDGTWAAHPGLIGEIGKVFEEGLAGKENLIGVVRREDAAGIGEEDLLERPRGRRTIEGLRLNTRVGIQYMAAWLTGTGSVPLYSLMEDAATAEISRVQNWQWIRYKALLDAEGVELALTPELFARVVEEEMGRIEREVGMEKFRRGMFKEACSIFVRQCMAAELDDFLTLDAYNQIVIHHSREASSL